jgi:hypothetical protein
VRGSKEEQLFAFTPGAFESFWSVVRAFLAPNSRGSLIDRPDDRLLSAVVKDPYVTRFGPDLQLRRLYDGTQYGVVKVMYEPDELPALLQEQG